MRGRCQFSGSVDFGHTEWSTTADGSPLEECHRTGEMPVRAAQRALGFVHGCHCIVVALGWERSDECRHALSVPIDMIGGDSEFGGDGGGHGIESAASPGAR